MQHEYLRKDWKTHLMQLSLKRKSCFYGGCIVVSNFQDRELPKVIHKGER